jgi:hypothetical protein
VLVSHDATAKASIPGTFVGRWVDPQGEPIREGLFQLVPDDPARKPGYAARAQGYFAGGRTSAAVTTDLDGRFRVEGLCWGDYLATEGHEHDWARIAGPFPTGREAVLVTALYRIEARVLDVDGRPIPAEGLAEGLELPLEWAVFCSPIDGAPVRDSPSTNPIPGRCLSDGTVVFEVKPACTYRVGYASPSFPTQQREVAILRERCCARVEICLPSPSPSGELELTIRKPDGSEVAEDDWYRVTIREAETGRNVPCGHDGDTRGTCRGPRFECALQAGLYDVQVSLDAPWSVVGGPSQERVEIIGGVTSELAIEVYDHVRSESIGPGY